MKIRFEENTKIKPTKLNKIIPYPDGTVEEKIVNPNKPVTKILDKNHYIDTRTGEVKEFRNPITKHDSLTSVSSKMNKSRELIYYNACNDIPNIYFVTLTFKENIIEYEIAEGHFKKFIRKLKKEYPNIKYGVWRQVQYDRKVWHFHLIIWRGNNYLLSPTYIENIWKLGIVDVQIINTNNDLMDVLFYLTNYNRWCNDNKVQKRIETLKYMDPNIRLFSHSQGLEQPKATYFSKRITTDSIISKSIRTSEFNGEIVNTCIIKEAV